MEHGATLKKKRLVKKFQSPIQNKGVDLQVNARSSAELVKNFITGSKKETMHAKASETHKRKHPMPSMLDASQGQNRPSSTHSKLSTPLEGKNRLPMRKIVTQSTGCSKNQDNSNDQQEANLPSKVNGTRNMTQSDASIQEQPDPKKIKRKPICPAMTIDEFLEKQGIHVEGEDQPAVQPTVEGVRSMPSMDFGENNYMLDDENDVDEHDELGIFDRDRDQVIKTGHVEGDVNSTTFISTYTC